MPQGIDASDGLLAQVTPLDEIDRAVVAAELLRQVFLGDFLAENRRSRLDAQDLEARGVDLDQAEVAALLQQSSP